MVVVVHADLSRAGGEPGGEDQGDGGDPWTGWSAVAGTFHLFLIPSNEKELAQRRYPFATRCSDAPAEPSEVEVLGTVMRGLKIPVSLVRFRVQALRQHAPTPAPQDANPGGHLPFRTRPSEMRSTRRRPLRPPDPPFPWALIQMRYRRAASSPSRAPWRPPAARGSGARRPAPASACPCASRRSRRALRQTRKTTPPVPCACSTAYSRSERCPGLTMGTVRKRVFRFVPRSSTVASPSPTSSRRASSDSRQQADVETMKATRSAAARSRQRVVRTTRRPSS